MKTVISGLLGFVAIAAIVSVIASYPARAEISCEFNVLPENDVIDTDADDWKNHRLESKSLTPRAQWMRGHVRVMISTLHDNEYHKGEQWYKDADGKPVLYDYQTAAKKAIISVEVWVPDNDSNPNGNGNEKNRHDEIEGCPVWMLVVDPRDGSGYVEGTQDDNRDNREHNTKHRGTLTVHDGFTATGDEIELTWGEPPNQTKNTVGLGVKLKYARAERGVDGKDWKIYHAKAILEITDRYGGDNYQIFASINQKLEDKWLDANKNPIIVYESICPWNHRSSGTMYAWKRCYLEVDKMFRAGHYLTADAVVGATEIQLLDVVMLNSGDKIRIFDVDEAGEDAVITAIDVPNKRITIDTDPQMQGNQGLTKAYQKGANNNEAAVGKLVFDEGQLDEAATFFLADLSLLKSCYDWGFVEFKELDGAGPVPYQEIIGAGPIQDDLRELRAFSRPWFKNKDTTNREEDVYGLDPDSRSNNEPTGKENYFQIVGAATHHDGTPVGIVYFSANITFVFVKKIETSQGENALAIISNVTAHEVGHQFQRTNREAWIHCTLKALNPPKEHPHHNDNADCVMNSSRDRTNGKARFCVTHIRDGFKSADVPPKVDPGIRDQKEGR